MARTTKKTETAAVKEAPVVKKTAAPAETVKKAEAPKKTASKAAASKATAKTAAKKTTVVENIVIQQNGSEISTAALVEKAKADAGVQSLKTVNIYIKPEENMVYYVINEDKTGSFSLC